MRDIKFRAWSTLTYNMYFLPAEKGGGDLFDLKESETWKVMQYTGLKDKNGSPIFEGDIVEIRYHYKSSIRTKCEWTEQWASFSLMSTEDGTPYAINFSGSVVDGVYVIGNIYENSELLTTGEL